MRPGDEAVETDQCPARLAEHFDPFHSPYLDDPYEFFAQARESNPVFYSELVDHWVVARYDDVRRVMTDTEVFSADNAQQPVCPWPAEAVELFQAQNFGLRPNLSDNDPPSHTNVRRFLRDAFTPRRLRWLEPHVRRLANEAVDRIEHRFIERPDDSVDLVEMMLSSLPAEVLFTFLGIPDADTEQVKRWSAGRALLTWGNLDSDEVLEQLPEFIEYLKYCFDLVDQLERDPGEDYTSELLRRLLTEEPVEFDKGRVAQTLFGLLMAGHETTTNQSGLAVRALLSNTPIWQRLGESPALIPSAVEELIRFDSSVVAWRRRTRTSVTLSGVTIPEGQQVLALLGSANRDPDHFENPDELNFVRDNIRGHMSFGHGPHHCIGAPLARLELAVMLEVLTQRLPDLELVQTKYEFSPNTSHRGPRTLPVRITPASLPIHVTPHFVQQEKGDGLVT